MKGIGDVLAADITGEWEIGKYAGPCERPRHTMRLLNLLQSVRGRQDGHQPKIGCALNRNWYGTTRECEVPGKLTH
jgi:hypothetical protein